MSTGFARSPDHDDAARGYARPNQPTPNGTANSKQFKAMAIRWCHGLIAHIEKAESCRPGCTNDALEHARAALDALQRPAFVQAAPVVVPKDEEE